MPLLLTKEIVWDDGKRRRERKKELETERAREKFVCEMIDPWQKGEKGGGAVGVVRGLCSGGGARCAQVTSPLGG